MADALAATPTSNNADTTKTPKDKNCPFCHAPFTSSSLGRHLDLYIKEKNAKPPDDIHDVEEIRRLRENVTRRQARTSSAKREGSTPSSAKATPIPDQTSPPSTMHYSSAGHPDGGPVRLSLNRPSWHTTGVINDLPPVIRDPPSYPKPRNTIRRTSTKEDLVRKHDALEDRERGRAAELALREVLESVKAANRQAHPRPPLDFNLFSLSFPAMCLQCLKPPPSFTSNPPFVSQACWSIEPPGPAQFECLRVWLTSRLKDWRQQRAAASLHSENKYNGANGHAHQQDPDPDAQAEEGRYLRHLENAYTDWSGLKSEEKRSFWTLEFMKSYVRSQDTYKETIAKLNKAEQEMQFLRTQLQRTTASQHTQQTDLSYDNQSSALSISPETALTFTTTTADDLKDWNIDGLIAKHKARLQSHRSAQQPLPTAPAKWPPSPHHSNTPLTNGTSPYTPPPSYDPPNNLGQQSPDNNTEDLDLADAPGDEDDQQHEVLDRGILDPDLRDKDTVMKGGGGSDSEGGRGEYGGGRMLMGLREDYGAGMGNGGSEQRI